MDRVDNLIAVLFQIKHCISQKVPGSALDGTLENRGTDQGISSPLPSIGVLAVDSDAELLATPWSGEQLELWPLPADKPA